MDIAIGSIAYFFVLTNAPLARKRGTALIQAHSREAAILRPSRPRRFLEKIEAGTSDKNVIHNCSNSQKSCLEEWGFRAETPRRRPFV
jgi:hypothetical protein